MRRRGLDWTELCRKWRSSMAKTPTEISLALPNQRSKIDTFNIAPSWTHVLNTNTVLTLGAFVRRDDYNYYPSSDPFADLGPPSLQRQSVGQNRTLTNAGLRSDLSYVKGIHQIKAGVTYQQTFLDEDDTIGIVDPTYNAPCIMSVATSPVNPFPYVAAPAPGITDPSQCTGAYQPNTAPNPNAPSALIPPPCTLFSIQSWLRTI